MAESTRAADTRAGRRLEVFTIGWNLAEAVIAVVAGSAAQSIALVGFGIDSLIESASGGILLWRLQSHDRDPRRERIALRFVGASFVLLAGYVAFEAVRALAQQEEPSASMVGIALSVVSLIAMPLLARAKRRVAGRLESEALRADARQTDLCTYLSAITLGGLALNATIGWWWADPVAALVMTPIIVREGVQALRGEVCDDCR